MVVAVLAIPHRVGAQSVTATITYPADGAVNADLSFPIQWTAVANAQAYYLYVGSTPGAKDLVNTGEVQTTSMAARNLPAGPTLYARMWTKVAGVWRYVDSTFTARPPVTATITYPADGEVHADLTRPIQWTTVANAQAYYLYVGSTPGAADLVNTGEVQQTSFTATNLPFDQTLYARIWTKVAGVWRSVDSTFKQPAPVIAALTYPVNGAAGVDITQPIRWTAAPNAQAYYLYIGSTAGAKDLLDTGEIQQTSLLATSLPFGSTLHVRLWTKISGAWRYQDSTFTASAPPFTATMTYPPRLAGVNGDVTLPFTWTTVAGAQAYYLYVGTAVGAKDLVDTGEISRAFHFAPNLPTGRRLYVRLWTKVDGVWRYVDSTFVGVQELVARLTNLPGDADPGFFQYPPLQWTSVVNAQAYYLYVGTSVGAKDLLDSGELRYPVEGTSSLPKGQTLYTRLWTKVAGFWRYVDGTVVVPMSTPTTSMLLYPRDGEANADLSHPIQWSEVWRRQSFSFKLGTSPGGNDLADTGETFFSYYRTGTNVPTGQTIYARIGTKVSDVWQYVDRSFTAAARTSHDVTVTFNSFGTSLLPFTTYAESGFILSATAAAWWGGTSGFPAPGVIFYATPNANVGQVLVTAAGNAPFSFRSVDLYSSVTVIPYTITGLRNSTPVFTLTGVVPNTFGNFRTVENPHLTDVIDALVITLTNQSTSCCSNPMGFDNLSLIQ